MKRLHLIILLAAVTLSGMAQTVGEEMYIYRNNGIINGFLPDEVQSIEFSYEDADGNTYDEVVTQIVNTADSVYRIPLAEIDSISFVTPKTEYQPGVINLSDELMPYVVSSSDDPLSITFSSATPAGLMPKVGDKLVTVEMNEKFPAGFAGEVTAVSGGVVTCQLVSLEDIFKTFSSVSSTYGYQEGANASRYFSRRAPAAFVNKEFKLGKFTWSKGAELSVNLFGSDNLALKGGTQLSIGITPSFHVVSTLIINDVEGTYFSACVTGDMTFDESVSAYGGIEWSKDFLDKEWVKEPVAPLTFFYVKPGLFFRAAATLSASFIWTQRFTWGMAFDFSTKKRNVVKPTIGGRLVSSSFDIEGALDGSVAVGGFVEVGLDIGSSDIDKVCVRGELGAEMVGHAVLYNSDVASASRETKVYERFKNSNIAVNAFVSTAVQAECGPWDINYSLPWNLSYNIKTWNVVPTFSNTTFRQKQDPQASADASVEMSGDCLIPVEVGLSVRDEEGNEQADIYAASKFDNGNKSFSYTFANLSADKDYTLYPKIRLFGYEMLASPSSKGEGELSCPDDNHPHWIDLGLPSGTLWQCCNEGASSPRGYGGYYEFGEVESAPSSSQILELISNTTYKYSSGGIFTGPNGNTIFFPAAGYNNGKDSGEECAHWSSTPNGVFGYTLKCSRNRAKLGSSDDYGIKYPVRPVRQAY